VIFNPPFLKRGITLAPWLILIPRWAKDDLAYKMHEQVHAEQQRRDGVLVFWFKYLTDKSYRQAAEVAAYKTQIIYGANYVACAYQLTRGYRLGITQIEAMEVLK